MMTINDLMLARLSGKSSTPDGKVFWLPNDIHNVRQAANLLRRSDPEQTLLLDSLTMPHWMYLTIVDIWGGQKIAINDPEFGPTFIPVLNKCRGGEGLTWRFSENKEYRLLEYANIRRRVLPDQVMTVIPPKLPGCSKGLVISGNVPPWLSVAICFSYVQEAAWVACTQKNGSALIAISRSDPLLIGRIVGQEDLQGLSEKSSLCAIPSRGEVWWFDDGYDPHPGLVVSPRERNLRLDDLLIIPITTSPQRQCDHYLPVTCLQSGLPKDSFFQVENISRISKRKLISGPLTKIADDGEVMKSIIAEIRSSIGENFST